MMAAVVILCAFVLLHTAAGSRIDFSATPDVISPCLSKTLTLRCSLTDTMSATGTIVGRDLTQTNYDVTLVLSVIVMKQSENNKSLASITTLNGGVAKSDISDVRVQGNLTSAPGERAFLEMTWDDPTSSETGDYVCEVNAIDPAGHSVVFYGTAKVTLDVPCPTELARRIHDLETKFSELGAKLNQSVSPHIEEGQVACGASDNWPPTDQLTLIDYQTPFSGKQVTQRINFNEPYQSTPKVHVGLATLGAYANMQYISYNIEATGVDKYGFNITCSAWSDSKYFEFNVNWISI